MIWLIHFKPSPSLVYLFLAYQKIFVDKRQRN